MNVTIALQRLKDNGYKTTYKREKILHFLQQQHRYTSVKEVINHLKKDYPGLSYETIYRNLALFTELGILEKTELDGEKKFQLRCGGEHHHHHLICIECGKTQPIENCPMIEMPKVDGFSIIDHKFEIYGLCDACQ